MMRRLLKRAAGRFPDLAIAAATALAWVTQPLNRGVDQTTIDRFFPNLDARAAGRLRRSSWTSWVRLRTLHAAVGSPTARWPYPRVVGDVDPAAFQPPLVIAGLHAGPFTGVGALLEQLPGEVLVLNYSPVARSRLVPCAVGTDRWDRAAAFRRAIRTLRSGGFVYVMVDANELPSTIGVTMFGRPTRLARGAFALARITGAPIVPILTRWQGARIEVVAGEPLAPGDEVAMAHATAAWIEGVVRSSPEIVGAMFANGFWGADAPAPPMPSGDGVLV
jgi:hypothetical protein